jgi:hypothetical protein
LAVHEDVAIIDVIEPVQQPHNGRLA